MVMRQAQYKEEKFFNDYITHLDSFKQKAMKKISEGVDKRHENKLLGDIFNDGLMALSAGYTVGNSISQLESRFSDVVADLLNFIEVETDLFSDHSLEQYIECLQILSFCYFFKVSIDKIKTIANHISLAGKDMLIDRLIAASIPDHPIAIGKLAFPEVYKPLADALSLDQPQTERNEKIQLFLKNYYPLLKKYDVTWHDDHKEKDPDYCYHSGYWIFELGALVAAIGWDDTAFRDHEFYPKDLVDWKFAQRPKELQFRI